MRTLCRWAKILRNITSRLARQKIWKNYACCTCSMRRKTTSLTVLPVYSRLPLVHESITSTKYFLHVDFDVTLYNRHKSVRHSAADLAAVLMGKKVNQACILKIILTLLTITILPVFTINYIHNLTKVIRYICRKSFSWITSEKHCSVRSGEQAAAKTLR